MVLVISIGKWCICIQQLCIYNFCNEQSMCSQIMLLYNFSTDDSTGMPSHVRNVIAVSWCRDSIELVYISAGLEAEVLDRLKGTFIRFSAQLGYEIHEDTEAAIRKLAPTLQKISAERVQVELTKLLISPHPDTLRDAYDMGVTKVILPEFDAMMKTPQKHKHHKYNVGEHTLHALIEIAPEKNLRYAILLHDIGKPETLTVDEDGTTHFHGHPAVGEEMARRILRRLRFDNDTVAVVTRLVRYHDYGNDVTPDLRIVRRAVNKIGEDIFPLLFPVRQADILAKSDYLRAEKLKNLELWKQLYEEMLEKKQCVSLKTLAVTGRDLIAMGMKPGRELGDMLQKLLELVLEHPEQNTREQLLEKAGELAAGKE